MCCHHVVIVLFFNNKPNMIRSERSYPFRFKLCCNCLLTCLAASLPCPPACLSTSPPACTLTLISYTLIVYFIRGLSNTIHLEMKLPMLFEMAMYLFAYLPGYQLPCLPACRPTSPPVFTFTLISYPPVLLRHSVLRIPRTIFE